MAIDTIEQAIADLQEGKMIIVVDDEDRENEGDLVMAADYVTPEAINFMITHGRGLVCVPMKKARMEALGIPIMVTNNTDPHGTAFGVSVDGAGTSTGISAYERSETIQALSNPCSTSGSLRRPGHIFPLQAKEGGVLMRQGHTEASVDLAELAGLTPMGVICEIVQEDGTMARLPQLEQFATQHGLRIVTIADLVRYRRTTECITSHGATFDAPTRYGRFTGMSFVDSATGEAHVALVQGDVAGRSDILVRVHSECLTGDALGSLRCDCGEQLRKSMAMIGCSDAGVLIYLRQEGRGIGLHNKLCAYELQDGGQDTYEANVSLGFPPDMREYHIAADILRQLDVRGVRLITNNPDKIDGLVSHGMPVVARVPLEVGASKDNCSYLVTKKERFGHLLTQVAPVQGCHQCR